MIALTLDESAAANPERKARFPAPSARDETYYTASLPVPDRGAE